MNKIQTIAKKAGVSVPTVYRVFNNAYSTSDEIKRRVMEVADELDYHIEQKNRRNNHVGKPIAIIADEINNPMYGRVFEELERALERYGFYIYILIHFNDVNKEEELFKEAIEQKCTGIFFIPAVGSDSSFIRNLQRKRFPLIQLFREVYQNIDTLFIDDEFGWYLATRLLLQLGHRKIMIISAFPERWKKQKIFTSRFIGYQRAYQEMGLEAPTNLLFFTTYAECDHETLKASIVQNKPSAVVVGGDMVITETLKILSELKLQIPDDISFVAQDNFAWMEVYGITTISQQYMAIGDKLAKLMSSLYESERNREEHLPCRIGITPLLEARQSVKSITDTSR